MEANLKELSKQYFNSVKTTFEKISYNRKIFGLLVLLPIVLFFIFFLFVLFGKIPNMISGYIAKNHQTVYNILGTNIDSSSLWIWYPVTIICSAIIFYLLIKWGDFLNEKTMAKGSSIKNIPFCYLYKTIEELSTYIVNERIEHLDTARKNLDKYLEKGEFMTGFEKNDEYSISRLMGYLENKYSWINYTEEARNIGMVFQNFESKIKRRLEQEKEVEATRDALENLLLYEFLKTNSKAIKGIESENKTIHELKNEYILKFAKTVETLEKIKDIESNDKNPNRSFFSVITDKLSRAFDGEVLVVTFISWYILIFLLLSGSLYLSITYFGIELDSKILIGGLTTPFLGATTITVGILSKNKKNNSTGIEKNKNDMEQSAKRT